MCGIASLQVTWRAKQARLLQQNSQSTAYLEVVREHPLSFLELWCGEG